MGNKKKATALKYIASKNAPVITAKGEGFVAKYIINRAKIENVPVVQCAISEGLSELDVGTAVPVEMWEAVAKVFAAVVEMERLK